MIRYRYSTLLVHIVWALAASQSEAQTCASNPICAENAQTAGVSTRPNWDIYPGYEDVNLVGFASPLSIDRSAPNNVVQFKIKSARPYVVSIFRLGWYGGAGARQVAVLNEGAGFPANAQTACAWTGKASSVDCSNWNGVPYTHNPSLPSGIYFARVTTAGKGRLIPFIVRDDSRTSDVLAQVPDTTWQAYNMWTDNYHHTAAVVRESIGLFYSPTAEGGVTVTANYNRPFMGSAFTDGGAPGVGKSYDTSYGFNTSARNTNISFYDTIFTTVRFLERNGVNVSYTTAQTVAANYAATSSNPSASLLLPAVAGQPRLFMTIGHDEYWSQEQRNHVERAGTAGVHRAFLTGNDMFWKVKWSDDFSSITCSKESNKIPQVHAHQATFTGLWSDGRYVLDPMLGPGGPENATTGLVSAAFGSRKEILVSPAEGSLRFWRNTPFAAAGTHGSSLTFSATQHTPVGHEWNQDLDNATRPSGLIHFSTTPMVGSSLNLGTGDEARGLATSTHHLSMLRNPTSGAITFHAGSISFGRALDAFRAEQAGQDTEDFQMAAVQHAMINLFADMGLPRPSSLQDATWWSVPPSPLPTPSVSVDPIVNPSLGSLVVISGVAGGGAGASVGGVEVLVRDPANPGLKSRWVAAIGKNPWRFEWTPPYAATFTVQARAINDFGVRADSTVQQAVVAPTTRILNDRYAYPVDIQPGNATMVWIGSEFFSDVAGSVETARFYNPHSGSYSVVLVDLGTNTVVGATSTTGSAAWHVATFSPSVGIAAGRHYVLLYLAKHSDGFAYLPHAFDLPEDAPPLHAVGGRYSYGSETATSISAVNASYAVDLDFAPTGFFSTARHPLGLWGGATPICPSPPCRSADPTEAEVGMQFATTTDGLVDGIRFYRSASDTGPHALDLWQITPFGATLLATAMVAGVIGRETWVSATFPSPVRTFRGMKYVAAIRTQTGYVFGSVPPAPATEVFVADSTLPNYPSTCCPRDTNGFCDPVVWHAGGGTYYYVEPMFRPTAAARQSIWTPRGVNPMDADLTQPPVQVGTVFSSDVDGFIESVRLLTQANEVYTINVFGPATAGSPLLCTTASSGTSEEGSGWRTIALPVPCRVTAGTVYTVSYSTPSGRFAQTPDYFPAPVRNSPMDGVLSALNGVYTHGTGAPTKSTSTSYFVDVVFKTTP